MSGPSLGRRLIAGAALWIALALLASGLILYELFRSHVTDALENALAADLTQLIAVLEIGPEGLPQLTQRPANPLFEKPYSGRYWQVESAGPILLTSRSLWDSSLPMPVDILGDGAIHRHRLTGPAGQSLIALERGVRLPESAAPLRITTAADVAELEGPLRRFGGTLAFSLAVLGLGLMAAVALQVRYGLRPLARLRAALGALRAGNRTRLAGDWPSEIRPLVEDFDVVLDHNARVLDRARTQAGNLAHALKTPLSVLANAADEATTPLADAVHAQVSVMQRQVDHHLARARAAAAAELPGAHADAAEIAHQLRRTLSKLYIERGIAVDISVGERAIFRGDAEDLMEILGNLLDNACKWARSRVGLRLTGGDPLRVTVEDDGPGLAPELRAAALRRGIRLDESMPGSGLGLAIVRDLVDAYGGEIRLDESPRGGLRIQLDLPGRPGAALV